MTKHTSLQDLDNETMTLKIYDYLNQFFDGQIDRKIARYVEGGLGQVNKGFKLSIIKGQKQGDISTDINPDSLANFLTGFYYGLQIISYGGFPDKNALSNVISNALNDLELQR